MGISYLVGCNQVEQHVNIELVQRPDRDSFGDKAVKKLSLFEAVLRGRDT